jgi:hypothetical protein
MEVSLPKYLKNACLFYFILFDSSMSPFATRRSKNHTIKFNGRGPTKELLETTSLEGFWPQKEICIKNS